MNESSRSVSQVTYDYVAYVDEAGDDGLNRVKPLDGKGSSEWLILAAVVISAERESEVTGWVQNIRTHIGAHQARALHFTNLSEAKRRIVCGQLSELPIRCFVVASNKKNMRGYRNQRAEKIPSRNWFYCWMTRMLLERVTHFVEARASKDFGSSRYCKIEYSRRGGLSYWQLSAYYDWLRIRSPFNRNGYVGWSAIDRSLLKVYAHHERAGLQLSDAVASAFFKACDIYDTGACDPQFAKLLAPRMARYPDHTGGAISGYGVKLMPSLLRADLRDEQEEIFRFYGYPEEWRGPAPS